MARKRNRRRRRRRSRALVTLSILGLVLVSAALGIIIGWDHGVGEWMESFSAPVVKELDLSGIHSSHGVLIQAKGGKTVGSLGENERIYPASLTKMMTALVALDELKDLEEKVTFQAEMFDGLYAEDASQAGFQPGETASLRDVLYGVLLPSGAECCNEIAYRVAGSSEKFVALMNQKAEKIGMKNTHFVNATGLHDLEHYSTCRDMALLLKEGLRRPVFREMISASYYAVPPTNVHPEGMTFYHLLFRNLPDPYVTGGRILGGKTGYTDAAGYCLASYAQIEGREYILVTAGAAGAQGEAPHVEDAKIIYRRLGEAAQTRSD